MIGLNEQEQQNVIAALRFLRIRIGGWLPLAKALGFAVGTMVNVKKGHAPVTVAMAFAVSRMVTVPFDDLLAGKYPVDGTCPHCGRGPG